MILYICWYAKGTREQDLFCFESYQSRADALPLTTIDIARGQQAERSPHILAGLSMEARVRSPAPEYASEDSIMSPHIASFSCFLFMLCWLRPSSPPSSSRANYILYLAAAVWIIRTQQQWTAPKQNEQFSTQDQWQNKQQNKQQSMQRALSCCCWRSSSLCNGCAQWRERAATAERKEAENLTRDSLLVRPGWLLPFHLEDVEP